MRQRAFCLPENRTRIKDAPMSKTETAAQGFNHTDLYRLDGKDSPGCAQFLMACSISWPCSLPTSRLFLSSRAPPALIPTTTGSLSCKAPCSLRHWHARSTVSSCRAVSVRDCLLFMGISFTFVTVLCGVAATYGFNAAIGAIMVGGLIEGVLGLFAKYWRWLISPIVAAVVVTSIGFSLLGWCRIVWRRLRASRFRIAAKISRSAASRLSRVWCSRLWRRAKNQAAFGFVWPGHWLYCGTLHGYGRFFRGSLPQKPVSIPNSCPLPRVPSLGNSGGYAHLLGFRD